MNTKEKIEKQLLIAMNAIDEMQHLVYQLPEEEGYQECFMSNLIDMKSKLKRFLNNDFDRLARERKENLNSMNLHERREAEMKKKHVCKNCGALINGWTQDDKTNNILTCFCHKCGSWNTYKYWP